LDFCAPQKEEVAQWWTLQRRSPEIREFIGFYGVGMEFPWDVNGDLG
jgi:hypothetical protein